MTSNERSTINTSHVGLFFAASAPFARKRAVSERSSRSATPRDTSLFLFPTLAMYLIDGISPSDTITVANRCAIISIILACACDCSDPTANVPRKASSTPTLKPFGSTVKYSRFISLQFPSMDTHALLALIAFKTPRGAAEVKNTCALRYSFFSQSSTTRATERSLGAMKYTPSSVGCGARATSKFSTTASDDDDASSIGQSRARLSPPLRSRSVRLRVGLVRRLASSYRSRTPPRDRSSCTPTTPPAATYYRRSTPATRLRDRAVSSSACPPVNDAW
mmetsp:Transcript_7304/g.29371  ORF Transcript_7304/g.29371 Transcript_7304/m.29371 type:complete len:278 (-) Transcript_7304:76-909(-)